MGEPAAVRAGVVARNPVSAAKKPRQAKRKVVPWTVAELGRIIAASDTYSAGRAVALMAAAVCRGLATKPRGPPALYPLPRPTWRGQWSGFTGTERNEPAPETLALPGPVGRYYTV